MRFCSCPANAHCAGDLFLATKGRASFAPAKFDLAGGATREIAVTANKIARKRIKRHGALRTLATAGVTRAQVTIVR